ncbi:MAG: hypothetical protein AB1730_02965 [Myxococcota bacterium]|jgi:ElaB/YqjD/DUF883 family membrane-anchored ribosome-binding protein
MDATPKTPETPPQGDAPMEEVLRERLGPQLAEAAERLTETNERVKRFIRENPGTCLLGAAALGFLIGRWAARR